MRQIQGKLVLLRVSGDFELPRVQIIGVQLYNTIQYNTIQYNTIQYNTIQYNTIQYNTIQYQYNTNTILQQLL